MKLTRPGLLVPILVGLAGLPCLAEEGRIPIYEPITLDGTLGDISGRYIVTRNITAPAGGNVYRGNVARGNGGITCGVATCGVPDFCDLGTGNTSGGDNFLPGPPPC